MIYGDIRQIVFMSFIILESMDSLVGNNTSREESYRLRPSISAASSWTEYRRYKGTDIDETSQAALVIGVMCLGCFSGFVALFCVINSLRENNHSTTRLYDCTDYDEDVIEKTEKNEPDYTHLRPPSINDYMERNTTQFRSTSV